MPGQPILTVATSGALYTIDTAKGAINEAAELHMTPSSDGSSSSGSSNGGAHGGAGGGMMMGGAAPSLSLSSIRELRFERNTRGGASAVAACFALAAPRDAAGRSDWVVSVDTASGEVRPICPTNLSDTVGLAVRDDAFFLWSYSQGLYRIDRRLGGAPPHAAPVPSMARSPAVSSSSFSSARSYATSSSSSALS